MDTDRYGTFDRCKNFFCTLYLLLSLALLGHVCMTCYPRAIHTVRAYLGGKTAQAFSALSDALGEGHHVYEVFSELTDDET